MLSKRNKKYLFLTALGSILIFVFLFLNLNFYFSNLLISKLSYKSDYLSNNSILKERISLLEARIKLQEAIVDENLSLKENLNYNLPKSLSLLNTELIIISPFTFTSSGIINKGSLDRVKKGSLVISPKGLVGKVAEVNKQFSKVLFTFNPNFAVMVYVGESKIPGILKGNGISSRIKYITTDQEVVVGDNVFIATNTIQEYPGIRIGEISGVVDYEGFLNLSIKDLINPRNAKFVTVIIND
ncbi:rod shape-determining protein MreC [bacterium]|jgi:rod shape-determining protein MreC|nr:rod shape-determining protein MreC [bacterium]MBT3795864.1 rod shape-determining protein MreC [bacterium]MBT4634338.1 rod shape-determining protein MreC [bacterium]